MELYKWCFGNQDLNVAKMISNDRQTNKLGEDCICGTCELVVCSGRWKFYHELPLEEVWESRAKVKKTWK